MPYFMLILDAKRNFANPFTPPEPVSGGTTGETDAGLMAVYWTPDEHAAAFETAARNSQTVTRFERLGE